MENLLKIWTNFYSKNTLMYKKEINNNKSCITDWNNKYFQKKNDIFHSSSN